MDKFSLPDLGEGLEDAEIVAWHVNVGDNIVADQLLSISRNRQSRGRGAIAQKRAHRRASWRQR